MQLNSKILKKLHQVALQAAQEAGAYIAAHRPAAIEHKIAGSSSASQVVTEIDKQSQDIILKVLKPTILAYDLGLLAEEQDDDGSRLNKDYFWCIDPLDGTLPFIENREGYAVAISLISKEGIPQIGVVYNPVTQYCYSAIIGQGAWRNEYVLIVEKKNTPPSLFHHRSLLKHPKCETILSEAKLKFGNENKASIEVISHAGAVMNAIWTIEKAPAYYFAVPKESQGGGCIWDYAATVCIFKELGLEVSDYYGKDLHLNRPESIYMNEFGVKFSTL